MKRHSERIWQRVSPAAGTKVAGGWWNREETGAFLQELCARALVSR